MSGCWAGSRHEKELDINAGRKKRKTSRGMQDEDVHILSFITALKFLDFFFCKCKSVKTKNDRTGRVKKKERCAVKLHVRDCCCRFHPVIGV